MDFTKSVRKMARCAYPNGNCTHPAQANSKFCENHSCRCGNAKRFQRRTCGNCGSGEEQLCQHPQGCQYPVEPGRDTCSFHTCGYCGKLKSSSMVTCPNCVNGVSRKCRHVNANGQQCQDYPGRNSQFCPVHTCRICGADKLSNAPTCTRCTKCVCGGTLPSGASQCANCMAAQAAAPQRVAYISQVQNAVQIQRTTWLFVWDFDNTITRSHASNRQPPIPNEFVLNDFADLEFFRKVVKHLQGLGHFVKVASWAEGFNARAIIAQYLAVCFGPNEQRSVMRDEGIEAFIPSAHGMTNEGKNIHICNLLGQINANALKVHTANVVLFDDNEFNVNLARQAGHLGVHCPRGFTRDVWASFMNGFGSRRPEFFTADLVSDTTEQGHRIRRTPTGSLVASPQPLASPYLPAELTPAAILANTSAPPQPSTTPAAPYTTVDPYVRTEPVTRPHTTPVTPEVHCTRTPSPTQPLPDLPSTVFNPTTETWERESPVKAPTTSSPAKPSSATYQDTSSSPKNPITWLPRA
eukprot:GGOE01005414.1.p1 GENE.GGOE01005414.1~~GGOE01005414.1.p1  ORF type:complete len:523 (-),score=47.86 GGOE01005414.1:236-1804(-)